jgi:hypothetical protein
VSGGATTLTGLLANDSVTGIMKPTPQAAATNVATLLYGIPTANNLTLYFLGTGTGGTPTASEVYHVRTMRAAPVAPCLLYTQTLTPTSCASATTNEQTYTVTGLISGTPVWVNPQTSLPAGIGIYGVRVSAANTLAINWLNTTGAAITPPAISFVIGNFQLPTPGAGNSVWQSYSVAQNTIANLSNAMRSGLVSMGLLFGG